MPKFTLFYIKSILFFQLFKYNIVYMAWNVWYHREKALSCAVFPKCGWSLFWSNSNLPTSPLFRVRNDKYPISKVNIDAFLIRHPVERLISGFKNKVLQNSKKDSFTEKWFIDTFKVDREEVPNISFDTFLDKLEELIPLHKEDMETCFFRWNVLNTHFAPMTYQLRFFPQEAKFFFDIRKDLDFLDYLNINYLIRPNSTQEIPFYATNEQVARIEKLYEDDMILYEDYEKWRINRPSIEEIFGK